MEIVHEHTAARQGPSAHRAGGIRFVSLLRGEEDTPGNFHLMLVHAEAGFTTPRHRHNFDQVRIMLDGEFSFGPGHLQQKGMLGYFTEGTYYTQSAPGRSTTLLLQSGGASGAGYMSDRQLRQAVGELEALGRFENGIYTWIDAQGKKHNLDGYEAAWQHVRGRAIRYPRPLYESPILWHQDRFAWHPTGQRGVQIRRFGEFTGKRLSLAQIRVQPGANCHLDATERETLVYCVSGQAELGSELLGPVSAVRLARGEHATLCARSACEFYLFGLMQ